MSGKTCECKKNDVRKNKSITIIQIEASEIPSFFGGTGRTFSLEVASFALTYEFSEAPKALRARFFARLGRFCAQTCSSEPPQDAWSLDFRVRDGCFSRFFQATSDQRAKRPTSKKHCKNQYETHFGASAH